MYMCVCLGLHVDPLFAIYNIIFAPKCMLAIDYAYEVRYANLFTISFG